MSYNGWTNYATWRVNLEVLDGVELRDLLGAKWYEVLEELLEELDSEPRADTSAMETGR